MPDRAGGPRPRLTWRAGLCAACALVGFAANSLLTRAAVGTGSIDSVSFSTVRLVTGAGALWLLSRGRSERSGPFGSWFGAGALALYAYAFAFAYERIPAGVGALLLFGSVQVTMIAWALRAGERPRPVDWLGIGLAAAGLAGLTLPGRSSPDPTGSLLMIGAGVAWGAYSLAGRGATAPLRTTTGNFARASGAGLLVSLAAGRGAHVSAEGVLLAAVSGALASGVGYTLWYIALPLLAAWRAALLQLTVPVLTAAGAVVFLHERLTGRTLLFGSIILGGLLLTSWAGPRAQSSPPRPQTRPTGRGERP